MRPPSRVTVLGRYQDLYALTTLLQVHVPLEKDDANTCQTSTTKNKLKRLIIEQHILQLAARDIIYPVYPSKFHWDNHCGNRFVSKKLGDSSLSFSPRNGVRLLHGQVWLAIGGSRQSHQVAILSLLRFDGWQNLGVDSPDKKEGVENLWCPTNQALLPTSKELPKKKIVLRRSG